MNGMNAHEYRSDKHPVDDIEALKKLLKDLLWCVDISCVPVMDSHSGPSRLRDFHLELERIRKEFREW